MSPNRQAQDIANLELEQRPPQLLSNPHTRHGRQNPPSPLRAPKLPLLQHRRRPRPVSQCSNRNVFNPSSLTEANQPRTARNSRPLEVIGTYDPIPKPDPYDNSGKLHKDIQLDIPRAQYWVGVGAQPTDTAWRLLSMVGVVPKKTFAPAVAATPKGTVSVKDVRIR